MANHTAVRVCGLACLLVCLTGAQDISTASCTEYVTEGGTLDCTCVGLCQGDDTVTPTWPGHTDMSNRLMMTNISRQRDGQQFECRMECDGQNYTTIYTLQVAYGPGETDTTVFGPSPLFTFNGTKTMTLTCNATVNPTPDYLWLGISCENGNTDNTCIYTPNITEDGTLVQCVVTNRKFDPPKLVKSDSYILSLYYPPQAVPEILTYYTSGPILKAGDILMCTVTGGKPLVSTVNFYCDTPHHQDQDDVRNKTAVSSSLVTDTSQGTEDNMTCYCSASWTPRPDFYTLTAWKTFQTQYPAEVRSFVLNGERDSLTVTESAQSNVTIRCEACGRPGPGLLLSVTSHDGTVNLTDTDQGSEDITVTSLDYNITMANWTDMGNYTCIARNGVGVKDSTTVTLNVNSKPRPASDGFEGRNRDTPLNMNIEGILIELLVYPAPLPENFNYIRYTNESDRTGETVSSGRFNSHVTTNGPGSNFVTCTITGKDVPEQLVGVYKVNISNAFGSVEYFFDVKPMYPQNEGGRGVDLAAIIGGVVAVLCVIIVVIIVVVIYKRKRVRGHVTVSGNTHEHITRERHELKDSEAPY